MATNNRDPYYVPLGTNVYGKLNLDKDKYDPDVATALGWSATPPTGDVTIVETSKALLATGRVAKAKATMFNGTGDAVKRRTVTYLCDIDKVKTAASALRGKTATLGNGTNAKPWTFGDIRIG